MHTGITVLSTTLAALMLSGPAYAFPGSPQPGGFQGGPGPLSVQLEPGAMTAGPASSSACVWTEVEMEEVWEALDEAEAEGTVACGVDLLSPECSEAALLHSVLVAAVLVQADGGDDSSPCPLGLGVVALGADELEQILLGGLQTFDPGADGLPEDAVLMADLMILELEDDGSIGLDDFGRAAGKKSLYCRTLQKEIDALMKVITELQKLHSKTSGTLWNMIDRAIDALWKELDNARAKYKKHC
jgi:hypothetical protein